jgi:hypothetical protein
MALKNNSKAKSTIELLGCTIYDFKIYLKNKFLDKMTFENYGEWHIDHIIPCSLFDLKINEAQFKCFHYSNMQPMWGTENIMKQNKFSTEDYEKLDDYTKSLLKEKVKNKYFKK